MKETASFAASTAELFPLSAAQSEIWYGQKLVPDSPCYSIGGYVDISGKVDPVAFTAAIDQAICEIDALRLGFVETEFGPRQFFRASYKVSTPYFDVRGEDDPQATALAWIRADLVRPFDLRDGPLFRYALFRIENERFLWYEVNHHLINDGFGSALVERRVAERYRELLEGLAPSGRPPSVLDLLDEDEAYRNSPQYERDRRFWRTQLADRPAPVTLSGRMPVWSDDLICTAGELPREVAGRLERAGAANGASLAAAITAVAAAHLSRASGARDVVLGMAVTARASPKTRRIVGLAANVAPMRLTVDLAAPFSDLLRQTARTLRDVLRHQRYPAGALRRDLGQAPNEPDAAGTLINFIPLDLDLNVPGWRTRKHFLGNWRVGDLMIAFHSGRKDTDIRVELIANRSHYDAQTLRRRLQQLLNLIESAAADPAQMIGRLDTFSCREWELVEQGWNATVPAPATLPSLFEAQAARSPDAIALAHGDTQLTYGQLNRRANRLARVLIDRGVGPEQMVGLCVERAPEMIVGLLAIVKAGAAYLPLDPADPWARLASIIEDAQSRLILTNAETAQRLPKGVSSLVIEADDGDGDANPTDAQRRGTLAPSHPAYVIYTSGSTGRPKGVVVTHASVAALAAGQIGRFGVTAASRVLQFASLNIHASLWEITIALTSGATLVLGPREARSGPPLRAFLATQRISHAILPQAVLATFGDADLTLDCLIVTGEGRPPGLAAQRSAGTRVINAYGHPESTVCATISGPLDHRLASIGAPIPGSQLYVLDGALEPAPIGAVGELYVSGAGLARGYLNRPGLTAERFVADPYGAPGTRMFRTGDLARQREDGALDFVGRTDRQIALRGFLVDPREIETALAAQPGGVQAVVAMRDDRPGGPYLAAYLAATTETLLDPVQLRRALTDKLPSYMVPSAFVILESLPLTPNGEVDHRALPAPERSLPETPDEPMTATEETVAAIWRDILRIGAIRKDDDFFDLGGHSLTAMRVVSHLRAAFGLELPLKTMFDSSTLEALAARIDKAIQEGLHVPRMPEIEGASRQEAAPLSFSQERMWLIQSLEPGSTAYNIPVVLRLVGKLEPAALSGALRALHERHDILRSTIHVVDGRPQQAIGPTPDAPLAIVDFRDRESNEAMTEAIRLAEADARTPFDLGKGSVMRSRLFRTAEETSLLSLVLHHVAGDQWSIGVLARELAALYNAAVSGGEARLPKLPVSYRDYALWQRSALLGPELERQMTFWRQKLDALPVAELPTDRPRPRLPSSNGAICQIEIPPTLLEALERLGRGTGSTLFMTMLTAFAALLHRLTGQEDIPIGVPVANRNQSVTEELIGTFVNTLVVRIDLTGRPTFGQALQRVRGTALDALANPDIPFDWLVQALGSRRDTTRAPLAQVLFNVVNAPMHGVVFDGLAWEPVIVDRGGAQFELSMAVDPVVTRQLWVEYNTDLFDRSTIDRLIAQYFTLLEAAAEAPDTALMALPPAEERRRLGSWNATDSPYPRDRIFVSLFEDQASRAPDAVAVSFAGDVLSYGELNAWANAIAKRLISLGVGPGVLAAVCVPRSQALLPALLGVQKSGGAYVPLDPDYPPQRLEYMLADSGAKVLIAAGPTLDGLNLPEGVETLDLSALGAARSAMNPTGRAGPQDVAYVIYTSGSTGRPKGVVVAHGALVNFLCSMQQRPGMTAQDVLAAVTTVSFDIAALELYLPLMVGARIELASRATAADGWALAERIVAGGASVMQATPATWRMLLEAGWSGRPGFRALCGGEPLTRDLADALLDRADELWNLYGPTETTVWSTLDRVERQGAISVGHPIANTQVHILDSAGEPTPIGAPGEIYIGGAGVAMGYLGRPGLTAERFVPDSLSESPGARLYRTGDLGRWSVDGKLQHLGRIDHQVKIRGFRIELGEIEATLRGHEAVREAVVSAREAQPGDQRLIAYVVYHVGEELTASEVRRYLRERLPDFMIPSIVVTMESLPLTPNGKMDRAALPDPFRTALRAAAVSDSLPAPGAEQLVAEIWRSVLAVERVSADDNFFELGGHSLLALRVAQAVEERTGHRMDPRTLFFHTLRQVAALLPPQESAADPSPSYKRAR